MYFYLLHWKMLMNYFISHKIFTDFNPKDLVGGVCCCWAWAGVFYFAGVF